MTKQDRAQRPHTGIPFRCEGQQRGTETQQPRQKGGGDARRLPN
ncbi:hypothetical protein [uncultured Abyssibacter sp.]